MLKNYPIVISCFAALVGNDYWHVRLPYEWLRNWFEENNRIQLVSRVISISRYLLAEVPGIMGISWYLYNSKIHSSKYDIYEWKIWLWKIFILYLICEYSFANTRRWYTYIYWMYRKLENSRLRDLMEYYLIWKEKKKEKTYVLR